MPLPYRGVSVQPYDGEMTEAAIVAQLLGREAYRRTEFIVLRGPQDQYAVVAVTARDREPLFSPIDCRRSARAPRRLRLHQGPADGLRQSFGAGGASAEIRCRPRPHSDLRREI